MNDDTLRMDVRPEVLAFVAAVRARFADLSEEEREELLGGLEADLSELVADRGTAALGDPVTYAEELRSAAGFAPSAKARVRGGLRARLRDQVQETRTAAAGFVERPRVAPWWQVAVAMRPAWWLLRAWVVAMVIARAMPGYDPRGMWWLPGVGGFLGLVIFLACLVVSALVGVGRLWPGGERGSRAARSLLAVNVVAVLALPMAAGFASDGRWAFAANEAGGWEQPIQRMATNHGEALCNVAAYDAEGNPLSGVQLFDQDGRPLELGCDYRRSYYVPWMLGDVPRWNVVPLATRPTPVYSRKRQADLSEVAFPVPDKAAVPPVTHLLVPPVEVVDPEGAVEPGEQPGEVSGGEEPGAEEPGADEPGAGEGSGAKGEKGQKGKGAGDKDDRKPTRTKQNRQR